MKSGKNTICCLKSQPKPLEAFHFLGDLVLRSTDEKRWEKTELYSKEYLLMSELFKDNWNFGNAIYYGNLGLSQVAFNKKMDSKSAVKYLLAASKTPGSPQLDSFGPFIEPATRSLLLDLAKSDQVEKWNLAALEHFEQQIRKNETPDFK